MAHKDDDIFISLSGHKPAPEKELFADDDTQRSRPYFDNHGHADTEQLPAISISELDSGPRGFLPSSPDCPPGQPRYGGDWEPARDRPTRVIALGVAATIVMVGGLSFAGVSWLSRDTSEAELMPGVSYAEQPTAHGPTAQGPTKNEPVPSTTAAPPKDPTFSWWGDGLSNQVVQWKPVIGAAGHSFAWHVSNDLGYGPDEVISDIGSGLAGGEKYVGGTVVFAYGTTTEVTEDQLRRLSHTLGSSRGLVLVGVGSTDGSIPWKDAVNARYRHMATTRDNTRFVDWQTLLDSNPALVRDGFIPTQMGADRWAKQINAEIVSLYGS